MYTIIEDCSPYYIRFKFENLNAIIRYLMIQKSYKQNVKEQYKYTHENLIEPIAKQVLNAFPLAKQIPLQRDRVAVFSTPPRGGCGIHKDAADHKVSINIPFMIMDDKCITSWYDEAQFDGMEMSGTQVKGYTRSVFPEYTEMSKFTPCKSVVVKPLEAMVLNTDIYHSWDNSQSNNWRKVLTFRPVDTTNVSYDTVRQILMENET